MKTANQYFARYGKIYGPFSSEEVEEFQATGRIRDFSWMWKHETHSWQAMDPAPILKPGMDSVVVARAKTQVASSVPEALHVLCHNQRDYVQASLHYSTQTGAELRTDEVSAAPVFAEHSPLWLNVYDERSQRQMNVRAKVCGVLRDRSGWRYRVRWDQPPEFR